jgi:hypothetical protein
LAQPSLSIEQLLSALQRKGIPLPFEMGTFLVLEATERSIAGTPATVTAAEVWLGEDGELMLYGAQPAQSEEAACRALVMLLGDLLVRSAPGVPPPLLALVEHGPAEWRLQSLRDDLEASLVPLNRGAMRRVMSRLLREVRRDVDRGGVVPPPDADALEDDLDAVLGVQGERPPRAARAATEPAPAALLESPPPRPLPKPRAGAPAQQQLSLDVDLDAVLAPRPSDRVRAHAAQQQPPRADADDAPAPAPRLAGKAPRARAGGADRGSLDEFEEMAGGGASAGARIGLGLLVLAAVLAGAYAAIGRQSARSMVGMDAEAKAPAAPQPQPAPARRYGELHVTSAPERAQVFMRVGSGPALVSKLPVGVAHEFLALHPGFLPSRAVVPADAQWQPEDGAPRYELALQLDPIGNQRARQEDLGATRLTQDMGKPSGQSGDVRVVTSPPGAAVYQLIGFTPQVAVQDLPVDQPVELLVFLPGQPLRRVTVGASDWKQRGDALTADVDVAFKSAR